MLKWVVKTGHSPNNRCNRKEILSPDEESNHKVNNDSLLDNSDWSSSNCKQNILSDTTHSDSCNNIDCDLSSSSTESSKFDDSSICHGLNADSGIYTNSQIDDSFSNDDSTLTGITDNSTFTDTAVDDTCSLDSYSVDFIEFPCRRNVTRSLDFDSFDLADEDSVILNGYHSEADSLDVDEVFVETDRRKCNRNRARKAGLPRRRTFHRKLSVDDTENEDTHHKRSRLVEQIDRETKLKLGAENLYKATANKRLKQTVEVELKFIQSHIKLLTDELADLDTAMENKDMLTTRTPKGFPMIQVGLKETKDIDFHYALKNFIEDHYYDNGDCFNKEIEAFETLRQMVRNPLPTEEGITLLFDYYNHLYFIDKRFFPPGRGIGVYFPWFDVMTNSLTTQRTMGFEKGCILFNIAALYSQLAAQKTRDCDSECTETSELLKKGAGVLKYLHDNFSYAPSTDMQSHTLKIIIQLMLTQAQECLLDMIIHKSVSTNDSIEQCMIYAQEAAQVYNMYKYARQLMHFDCIKDYMPHNWHILVQIKTLYYKAISNYYAALTILSLDNNNPSEVILQQVCDMFETMPPSRNSVHISSENLEDVSASRYINGSEEEKRHFAKACLSRSVLAHEEALRIHCQHQKVKRIPYYHDVHQLLKSSHDKCFHKYSELDEEDDFTELSHVPNVKGKSSHLVKPVSPDFSKYKVMDPFQKLGPLAIFCARHYCSEPQRVELHKKSGQEFGFSVRGEQPVIVSEVDDDSIAQKSGVKPGDFIVYIGNTNVKWFKHSEVVQSIRNAGQNLVFNLVTPLDKNYLNISNKSTDNSKGGKEKDDKANNNNSRHVMQCGTLERNKHIRLSGRSTKSLTYTLRRLKPGLHTTGKDKDKRNLKDVIANFDRNKH